MYNSYHFYVENYKIVADCLKKTINNNQYKDSYEYIEPDQYALYGFVEALFNSGLIDKNKNLYKICDVGFGLGTSLYNIYQQLRFINPYKQEFEFCGIEINKEYFDLFNKFLKNKWKNIKNNTIIINDIEIINDDMLNVNYNDYDIIYIYVPFKNVDKMIMGYKKILNEMKKDALLFELFNNGKGKGDLLYSIISNNKNIIKENTLIFGDGIINNIYKKI